MASGADVDELDHTEKPARAATRSERLAKVCGELGDYELLEEVGRGGQGVVFRAHQKSLNRSVAVKVISLGQWASKAHLQRFRREAEAAASLDHPSIVPIYEVGERDGSCYFSMKFIEGGQLDAVVKRAPMSITQAAALIAKVARTVHYAHEHGILHRDIKPGNILLDGNGEPHLTDFGLARLVELDSTVTRTLGVMGTPSYMAPEQAEGNNARVSTATDVYGLGAVLYQLVTGQPPFAGGTTYETIKLLLDRPPRAPRLLNQKIDRDLSVVCLKCLEKDPQQRYQSALQLAEDLERWLRHEPIAARRTGLVTRAGKWVRRKPTSALLAAALVALIGTVGWGLSKSELLNPPVTTGIAILPFENLSEQNENAGFADGLQDDILTKLAKIADLKVISRTSVMDYRGKRNVRQIGDELRVSHVLEGSVRRTDTRLHLNAQLIDTRTDTHVWAEQFDRDFDDLFAIQSEIAEKIARQLHVKISAAEKRAIDRRPTGDLIAFDLYSRAKDFLYRNNKKVPDPIKAVDLLNSAVARDPSFFEAYCQLAMAHDGIYFGEVDHTPARLALAENAIDSAFHLQPDSGEAHLAKALHRFWGFRDYDGAVAELEIARQTLPNQARIFQITGFIQRRQGRWDESRRNLKRAAELDPRDIDTLQVLAGDLAKFGRYAEGKEWLTRAVAVAPPGDVSMKLALPDWELEVNGDLRPLRLALELIRANPAAISAIAGPSLMFALNERDSAAAREAFKAIEGNQISMGDQVAFNRSFIEGLIARLANDEEKAQLAFTAARAEQEKLIEAQPDFGPAWCVLGMIDAELDRKEEALGEGRHALELLPIEKDAVVGRQLVRHFAAIAALVGEKDLACQQLATLVGPPNCLHYGSLKLGRVWDPLRGEPCFERILASISPKENQDGSR